MTNAFLFHIRPSLVIAFILLSSSVSAQQTPPPAYPSNIPINYVRTWDATAPEADPNNLMGRPLKDVKQTTQYIDGLGRPIETIIKQGSFETGGTASDWVVPVVYDEFGREQSRYAPFMANNTGGNTHITDGLFKTNPFQEQAVFMQQQYSAQGETYFYGRTDFELSPLDRPVKVLAPGNNWVGNNRGIESQRWANTPTDDIRIWTVTDNAGTWGSYTMVGAYAAGKLYKNVTVDENGAQVEEFRNLDGLVIMKKVQLTDASDNGGGRGYNGWLCTYYIYDNLSNLRCVVQPGGVELLIQNGWNINVLGGNILNEQCFRYEYDERNNISMKKVPGAGEVWMVYDARNRLVLSQDANLRSIKWLYTQYDEQNRPIATGLIDDTHDRAYHANLAKTSTAYPNLASYSKEVLTQTLFDDYTWLSSFTTPFSATRNTSFDSYLLSASNSVWPYPQSVIQSVRTQGLVTGTRTEIPGTGQYLYSINYYDEKGRVIQTQSTNLSGGVDITTIQYNFSGQPLVSVLRQEKAGAPNPQTHIIVTKTDYDDLGRLVTVKKAIYSTVNGVAVNKAEEVIVSNSYNNLGQLKSKKLAPAYNSGQGLETLNYDYNIRGWMLAINKEYLVSSPVDHWFGMELGYDKSGTAPGTTSYTKPEYNGNISGSIWRTKGDGIRRKMDYDYDLANRFNRADYTQNTSGSGWEYTTMNFSVWGFDSDNGYKMKYDANGNILSMIQGGWKAGTNTYIDALHYTYIPNTNKLKQVWDDANDQNTTLGDFHYNSATKTATDYAYDANGNLIQDNNKAISSITYNHLNLPSLITVTGKGTITYTYDAAGNKLKESDPGKQCHRSL